MLKNHIQLPASAFQYINATRAFNAGIMWYCDHLNIQPRALLLDHRLLPNIEVTTPVASYSKHLFSLPLNVYIWTKPSGNYNLANVHSKKVYNLGKSEPNLSGKLHLFLNAKMIICVRILNFLIQWYFFYVWMFSCCSCWGIFKDKCM